LIDGAALPAATDALAPAAEGDANGEVARRRRRRGGRGRNRGDGATGGDVAVNSSDEAALESDVNGADRVEAIEPEPRAPVTVAMAEPPVTVAMAEPPVSAATVELPVAAPPMAAPVAPRPVAAERPIVVPSTAPAAPSKAEPYALPIDRLNAVASQAGLEWVHSDSDKVRAAQAAIAAEANPPRVPRQPKPPVAIDDGPLVLVETKKDLSQITLPFDRG
jgi:ribonuclease E